MSSLQGSLKNYLTLRRSLGFKLTRPGMWLPEFVRFVEQTGSSVITSKLALQWAMGTKNPPPESWPNRLRMVRKFAQYLHAHDSRHEIPSPDLAPRVHKQRMEPYVYTDTDVQKLMAAARKIRHPLKGETYATLIGLLAATGMRVGEAIALKRSDFDATRGVLTIRNTKFNKSRYVPLHRSATQALRAYSEKRDQAIPRPRSTTFFISTAGTRLIYLNFHFHFLKILRDVGLNEVKPQRPRIHDLRHSFAIKTLTRWYRAGLDPNPMLPALSTYLGHVSPSSTYWYLSAKQELLQQARRRLEKSQGGRS